MRRSLISVVAVALALGARALPAASSADDLITVTGSAAVIGKTKQAADSGGVVVWLEPAEGMEKVHVVPPRTRPRVVQRNKRFEPHLLVVTVGTDVDFPNLDPFFHNVFSLFDGKRFDLGLYEAGGSRTVSFDAPGICYIFCNIHPEMSAAIVVVDSPYYATSKPDGQFSIPNVEAGHYLLYVWHERGK